MRVLVYGGCHADVLRWSLEEYGGVEGDALLNYKLIEKEQPFPYGDLSRYDAVVFNPIFRDGQWNTLHLEEECRRRNIPIVKYPWLEWSGYWPNTKKSRTGWGKLWWSLLLDQEASRSPSLQSFVDAAFDTDIFSSAADNTFEASTKFLRGREVQGEVDVPISDFVLKHYRERRLFLTPDHPANETYFHVIRGIAEALGLRMDRTFFERTTELQKGTMLPILPGVAKHLSLGFPSGEFAHPEVTGPGSISLRSYLEMHYRKAAVRLLSATTNTTITTADGRIITVKKWSRMVASQEGENVNILALPDHADRIKTGLATLNPIDWNSKTLVQDAA